MGSADVRKLGCLGYLEIPPDVKPEAKHKLVPLTHHTPTVYLWPYLPLRIAYCLTSWKNQANP